MEFLPDILEEHLEEADFLYTQRRTALEDDDYNLLELAEMEERLLAHIDGLVIAGDEGWNLLEERLASDDEGEAFVAALTALASGNTERREELLKVFAAAKRENLAGLKAALCLFGAGETTEPLRALMAEAETETATAILEILAFHRKGLSAREVESVLASDENPIRCAGLQTAAAMGWRDLADRSVGVLAAEDPSLVAEAVRTGFILGRNEGLQKARELLAGGEPLGAQLQIWLGLGGSESDRALLTTSLAAEEMAREAVIALGWLGNPAAIDDLLRHLDRPDLARQIGAAMRRITGVDLATENLVQSEQDEAEDAEPEDDFADPVFDPDEALPWPDTERIAAWWQENRRHYAGHDRFRYGQKWDREAVLEVLRSGGLQERHLAACELARMGSGEALPETRALAWHQNRLSE
jgi:uncharacterized protein (TIGR02270 family)